MGFRKDMTFAIIKPDAVEANHWLAILHRILEAGFHVQALEMRLITIAEAEELYKEHLGRPYYHNLIKFTVSGKSVVIKMNHHDNRGSVKIWRDMMGDTHPDKAPPSTLRYAFGTGVPQNAVHGSDSDEAADRELAIFFP